MSVFTEVHAKHVPIAPGYGDYTCICGQWFPDGVADEMSLGTPLDHAAHVEAELAKAGAVVVELPEADAIGRWRIAGTDIEVDLSRPGGDPELGIEFASPTRPSRIRKGYDVSVAPDLAGALLAAVAAEGNTDEH